MPVSCLRRLLKASSRPRRTRRPCLEALEARDVPASTFLVTTTADGGPGSLRQAILDANANGNPGQVDQIQFNLPGVPEIQPTSPLPAVTEPALIDGYTQPGASRNTLTNGNDAKLLVVLDGGLAGPGADGLVLNKSFVSGLVISHFGGAGLVLNDSVADGNFIGTDAAGKTAQGNGVGVLVSAGRVGFADPGRRNLISGNGVGVVVDGSGETFIEGNYIGTDAGGNESVGNRTFGVHVVAGKTTHIGGSAAGAGNVIGGNGLFTLSSGVRIDAPHTTVEGNFIGVPVDLVNHLTGVGNGLHGIVVRASDVLIGGTLDASQNVIVFNGGSGVAVVGGVTGVRVTHNHIEANGGLSVDLGGDGPTANDPLDADSGPNGLANAPVLTSVLPFAGSAFGVTVTGTLTARPNTLYRVEVYATPEPPRFGAGEGAAFAGFTTARTDALGNATFGFVVGLTSAPPNDVFFAANATDAEGNTSEFSPAAKVGFVAPPAPAVEKVVVNDGSAQRSQVRSLSVVFNTRVNLLPGAFELKKQGGGSVGLHVQAKLLGGKTVAVLTFFGPGTSNGLLADGKYQLLTHGTLIRSAAGAAGAERADAFFRLFGDSDGDGDVDGADRYRLLQALGATAGSARYRAAFDYEPNGVINANDLFQLNKRFGARLLL